MSWFYINFKNTVASGELMHLWSDLGKIKISPSLVGQITFFMIQMITRYKDLSNELSWAQFGVEEDLQKLTATALCLEATSFFTFWPVLGDLIFDKENELQIEILQLCWKLDSIIFPTSYPAPNLDTRKVSKSPFSQHCFLCVKIGAMRSLFECFWPIWGLKPAQISWP